MVLTMLTIEKVRSYWVRGGYQQFVEDIKCGKIKSTELNLSACSHEERLEILRIVNNLHLYIINKNIGAFVEEITYKESYSERMGGYYFHDFEIVVPEATQKLEEEFLDIIEKST